MVFYIHMTKIFAVAKTLLQFWVNQKLHDDLKKKTKLVDAPKAGEESQRCSLILCVRESAKNFVVS